MQSLYLLTALIGYIVATAEGLDELNERLSNYQQEADEMGTFDIGRARYTAQAKLYETEDIQKEVRSKYNELALILEGYDKNRIERFTSVINKISEEQERNKNEIDSIGSFCLVADREAMGDAIISVEMTRKLTGDAMLNLEEEQGEIDRSKANDPNGGISCSSLRYQRGEMDTLELAKMNERVALKIFRKIISSQGDHLRRLRCVVKNMQENEKMLNDMSKAPTPEGK
jgi:hypothetical protein